MTALDRVVGLRLLAVHQFVYEVSGGRIGERIGRSSMLLLRTTGRKTGQPRTAALLYHRDRDHYVVIGSKGGSDAPPPWLLNLQTRPDVEVQVGTELARRLDTSSGSYGAGRTWRRWWLAAAEARRRSRRSGNRSSGLPRGCARPAAAAGGDVPRARGVGCTYSSATRRSGIVASNRTRHSRPDRAATTSPSLPLTRWAGDSQPLDRQLRRVYSARPCSWPSSMRSSGC